MLWRFAQHFVVLPDIWERLYFLFPKCLPQRYCLIINSKQILTSIAWRLTPWPPWYPGHLAACGAVIYRPTHHLRPAARHNSPLPGNAGRGRRGYWTSRRIKDLWEMSINYVINFHPAFDMQQTLIQWNMIYLQKVSCQHTSLTLLRPC